MAFQLATSASAAIRTLGSGLLDAVLPQTCAACGEWIDGRQGLVCAACHAEVQKGLARPYCPRCGRTAPQPAIHADGCARCKYELFWNVAGVARVSIYTPAVRRLVLGLKYRGWERNAEYLADHLAQAMTAQGWLQEIDALAPVPMHWLRRGQRPCDHAAVLTEALARRIRRPVIRLVRRARHAPSQTNIPSKAARFENVRGCFAAPPWWLPPWPKTRLTGWTVCIVDNLVSTGATIAEVSKVLRRAGAKRIYAATIARPAAPGDPAADLTAVGVPADYTDDTTNLDK
jgi:predicted amidophosphoribosyltransferase